MKNKTVHNYIIVKGARQHNLKNIDVDIPKNKLVVITGPSGSGKSSLAFDTIYAEGQRRYVESLSSYARQFLNVMDKPEVDSIEGLSPAIAIDQKTTSHNPRSTVGTITEIYDYIRVFWANLGKPKCPICKRVLEGLSAHEILEHIYNKYKNKKVQILSPIVRGKKGEFKDVFKSIEKQGFSRVKVDGNIYRISEVPSLNKNQKHDIDIIIDRLTLIEEDRPRALLAIEKALEHAQGLVKMEDVESSSFELFSENMVCPEHGFSIQELSPRLFSFNSPYGACPVCKGIGVKWEIDESALVDINAPTINAIRIFNEYQFFDYLKYPVLEILRKFKINPNTAFKNIPKEIRELILYGSRGNYSFYFEGIIPHLEQRYMNAEESDRVKDMLEGFIRENPCPVCEGSRLKQEALSVFVLDKNIWDVVKVSVDKTYEFFDSIEEKLTDKEKEIAKPLLKEIKNRIKFLLDVGLDYISLGRSANTLSGGEMQRIRLATQVGSKLTGVLYVLDEPSIGLHPRDTGKLINTLKELRDLGNTVIVVEHDHETIESADYVLELGPGAGKNGGYIVSKGSVEQIKKDKKSLTGGYLSGRLSIEIPKQRRKPEKGFLTIVGAKENNLKNITVRFPAGLFICVTGVSGSGKSSLVYDILWQYAKRHFYSSYEYIGKFDKIEGIELFDKAINVDQSPIGRTPRSNPATYVKVFDAIRELFSQTPEAKARGYTPGRFSFNVEGGRCEACQGEGVIKVEMHFLPPVYVTCDVCKGTRYNKETLDIRYNGKNISDVLNMTVDEAYEFFKNIPSISKKLKLLQEVGLGYISLGQNATTLSGGEAQRIKLSKELSKKDTGNTLYFLDEPTTGLHTDDIKKLISILQRLVDKGNTVVVIEHNLDVIKCADWIIDIGPESGNKGGYLLFEGPPEELIHHPHSYTAKALKPILEA
jgi:Excinuclease ABC subunit A